MFALGIYTGLRLGDCATLRWGEVDLARGVIRRIPSKTARRNPKPVLVPLHATLRAMLDEIPAAGHRDYNRAALNRKCALTGQARNCAIDKD